VELLTRQPDHDDHSFELRQIAGKATEGVLNDVVMLCGY
jgi:hypothetical protein